MDGKQQKRILCECRQWFVMCSFLSPFHFFHLKFDIVKVHAISGYSMAAFVPSLQTIANFDEFRVNFEVMFQNTPIKYQFNSK